MRSIKAASTLADLFSLVPVGPDFMLHRATILLQLAQLGMEPSTGASVVKEGLGPECKALLLTVMQDLRAWKSSGSMKGDRKDVDPWNDRQKYLGNIVWALGSLESVLAATLSENERVLLFEHATLAVLEALPDLISRQFTKALYQIVFGLRLTTRNLQVDVIYKTLAGQFPDLLSRSGTTRDLVDVLHSYSQYGMSDPEILNMFVRLRDLVATATWGASYELRDPSQILVAYGRYAAMCNMHADPVDIFSVSLDKKGTRKLGVSMKTIRSRPTIEIVGINRGLVGTWNRMNPEWEICEGHEIIKANAISDDAQLVAKEIISSDTVMLTVRRGKVRLEVTPPGNTTMQTHDVLEAIKDEALMEDLALQVIRGLQQKGAVGGAWCHSADILSSMVLLGMGSKVVYKPLLPLLRAEIPRIGSGALLRILVSLSIQDVFDDRGLVQGLAERALLLHRRKRIYDPELFFPAALRALELLQPGPDSEVVRQLRTAAKRDGISQAEMINPPDPIIFLTGMRPRALA